VFDSREEENRREEERADLVMELERLKMLKF